jgi:hypothetical protein
MDGLAQFMANADDSVDSYIKLMRETPITTPWLSRYLIAEAKSADNIHDDETRIAILASLLATALQRLANETA